MNLASPVRGSTGSGQPPLLRAERRTGVDEDVSDAGPLNEKRDRQSSFHLSDRRRHCHQGPTEPSVTGQESQSRPVYTDDDPVGSVHRYHVSRACAVESSALTEVEVEARLFERARRSHVERRVSLEGELDFCHTRRLLESAKDACDARLNGGFVIRTSLDPCEVA